MIRSDDRFGLDGWFAGCWPTMTHSTMIQEAINKYLSNGNLSVQRGERPFKVVLFDMDGVLYDSMPHHAIAWQKAMAQFGLVMALTSFSWLAVCKQRLAYMTAESYWLVLYSSNSCL